MGKYIWGILITCSWTAAREKGRIGRPHNFLKCVNQVLFSLLSSTAPTDRKYKENRKPTWPKRTFQFLCILTMEISLKQPSAKHQQVMVNTILFFNKFKGNMNLHCHKIMDSLFLSKLLKYIMAHWSSISYYWRGDSTKGNRTWLVMLTTLHT